MSNTTNIVGPCSKWEPTTNIAIRRSTWKRLQKYHSKKYGSTFDSVLKDLLDEKEKKIDSDMEEGVQKDNLGEFKL